MSNDLLSIDLEAELAKLTLGRLRNRDQALVALARAAARSHPSRLHIQVSKSRIRLGHDGQVPGEPVVRALSVLFDLKLDDLQRQEALENLESQDMLDLLVAFAVGARRVELKLGPPANVSLLMVGRSDGTRIFRSTPDSGAAGVSLEIQGADLHAARLEEELCEAVVYTSFAVELNQERKDQGLLLREVLLQRSFEGPGFQGVAGLPRKGTAATLRILTNGILEKEAWESPPDGRVYEAVVDFQDSEVDAGLVQKALDRQSEKLYDRLREHYDELNPADQLRAKQLLFRLADSGAGARAVAGVRIFSNVNGERLDVTGLRRTAVGRIVRAVTPQARKERFLLDGPELVLDSQERGFIEKHLGLQVREPSRKPRRRLKPLTGLLEQLRRGARKVWQSLAGRKVLAPERLAPAQRNFLDGLLRYIRSEKFMQGRIRRAAFCRGRLSGFRVADRIMMLPVNHPQVQEMVAAYQRDPQSLFASLMLLSEGREAVLDLTDPQGIPIFPG